MSLGNLLAQTQNPLEINKRALPNPKLENNFNFYLIFQTISIKDKFSN